MVKLPAADEVVGLVCLSVKVTTVGTAWGKFVWDAVIVQVPALATNDTLTRKKRNMAILLQKGLKPLAKNNFIRDSFRLSRNVNTFLAG